MDLLRSAESVTRIDFTTKAKLSRVDYRHLFGTLDNIRQVRSTLAMDSMVAPVPPRRIMRHEELNDTVADASMPNALVAIQNYMRNTHFTSIRDAIDNFEFSKARLTLLRTTSKVRFRMNMYWKSNQMISVIHSLNLRRGLNFKRLPAGETALNDLVQLSHDLHKFMTVSNSPTEAKNAAQQQFYKRCGLKDLAQIVDDIVKSGIRSRSRLDQGDVTRIDRMLSKI